MAVDMQWTARHRATQMASLLIKFGFPKLKFKYTLPLTQPRRSLNAGYSWPGVFLLGASGRTGRFFTQLLFHNPASVWHLLLKNFLILTMDLVSLQTTI